MNVSPQGSASDEAWKIFAESSADFSPGATITTHHHQGGALGGDEAYDEALARPAPPVTIPELPYLAVAQGGAAEASVADADFEVTSVLGEGGMGKVLLARQRSLRREVAIKVVKSGAEREETLNTLLAEAVVTGSIEHPSVVPIHALGRDNKGRPILVMKRIEGVSWRELTRSPDHPVWAAFAQDKEDRLDAHLEILMAVCNAVHFANSRGIVHRDIKLDNVMLGSFGEVYVVDWGIATRAATPGSGAPRRGPLVGTPAYMSPEMVHGDLSHTDARTDVYLLGATLHAVLTGSPRHTGETLVEVLMSARDSEPFEYGPGVPAELAAICNKATSASPEGRYKSALELRRALSVYRRHKGSIAMSDEAAAKLAEIRAISAAGARADERRVHGLMTECRFGFMHALRAWKENEAAKAGLESCLEVMIEHELAQRDAEGARSLYAELSAPRPDLERRIEALTAELRGVAQREARLQAMERDIDLRIGARGQLYLVGLMVIWALGLAALVFYRDFQEIRFRDALFAPASILTAMVVGIFFGRKHLRTAISRKAFGALILLPSSMLVHRVLAMRPGVPVAAILIGDMIIGVAVASGIAVTILPWIGVVAIPCLLGAIFIALRPDMVTPIYAVSVSAAMLLLLVGWLRSLRASKQKH
jgi:hypothetical protein